MSLPLYMDHNVIGAITSGCRRRGLDVLTAFEDGRADRPDEEVLQRATDLGRIVFTQDVDFVCLTGEWIALDETSQESSMDTSGESRWAGRWQTWC